MDRRVDAFEVLSPFERFAFRAVRFWNEGPGSRVAALWQSWVLTPFVSLVTGRRMRVVGFERVRALPKDRSILLVSNHRTFFDQFVLGAQLQRDASTRRRPSFPVRANFFYENPLGLVINILFSGASMFPPFFRSVEKRAFNRFALQLLVDRLRGPREMIGFHPEGTRSKSSDPYTLLPAQPGVGELALKARPLVVPAFITGLTNSLPAELWANLRGERPIVAVFGDPIDLSQFPSETRQTVNKRCADLFNERILALAEEEKRVRASLPRGGP